MKTQPFKILIIAYALLVQTPMVIADAPSGLNSDVIGKAMDTPATVKPDGVVRVGWQRDDEAPDASRFGQLGRLQGNAGRRRDADGRHGGV